MAHNSYIKHICIKTARTAEFKKQENTCTRFIRVNGEKKLNLDIYLTHLELFIGE